MKAKELLYAVGIKPKPRTYPHAIRRFDLAEDGAVEFAQWLHPSARRRPTLITQPMVNALRTVLSPGDFAIDVGAHGGDSTLPIALAAGAEGLVLALEPNPYAFPVLAANAGLNRDRTNIRAEMIAATTTDGEFVFHYSDAGFCNGGLHEGMNRLRLAHFFDLQVTGRNLEQLLRRDYATHLARLRYIKLDTEGHDTAVLRSIEPLLREQRPFIRLEIFKHATAGQRVDSVRHLEQLGYRLHRLTSEEHYDGERIGVDDVMRWSHFDVLASPPPS